MKDDGWTTEPFVLTHDAKTDRLYGRGSTDDKGPVLGWLNVIQAHKEAEIDFPVNLLMCFEGMEENGSEGLDELIAEEANMFFKDNYWLGTTKSCLTVPLLTFDWELIISMVFVELVISTLLLMDLRKIYILGCLAGLFMSP